MIAHIEAISRKVMEDNKDKLINKDDIAIISIIDPHMPFIFESQSHKLIQLKFSDIEPSPFLKHTFICESESFMNTKQAGKIVSFINMLVNDDKEWKLIINCSAGICRSGAIAQFAQAFSIMKDAHFATINMQIKPNMWVFNLLIYIWLNEFKDELKVIQFDNLFD